MKPAVRTLALGLVVTPLLFGAAMAQTSLTPFGPAEPGKKAEPLEITADSSLEWLQSDQAYVARGNAVATRGNASVYADTLTAFYKEDDKKPPAAEGGAAKNPADISPSKKASGNVGEIWRAIAEGNVRIVSNGRTAYGDKAVYDVDRKVVVLTGKDLKVITPTETVSARDVIEYWEEPQLAVARGAAIARKGEDTLSGDVLTAKFEKGETGSMQMQNVDAFGNVVITTAKDVVRGAQGTYDMKTKQARIVGPAKLVQNGKNAPVVVAAPPPAAGQPTTPRVRGLFVPKDKEENAAASATPAAATPTAAPAGQR